MSGVDFIARGLSKDQAQLKTGVVQYFVGSTAQVAVEGSLVTMQVLDSVTLSLGMVVVCSVYGRTGYVLGSLGTTSRAESAIYDGGYGNPLAPDTSTLQTLVSTYSPLEIDWWRWHSGTSMIRFDSSMSGTQTVDSSTVPLTTTSATGTALFWFYGDNAMSELANAVSILKIEVYLAESDAGTSELYSHAYGTKPGTGSVPTITNYTSLTLPTADTWVEIPVATYGAALQTGTFGMVARKGTYSTPLVNGYGQIRVTWTS